MRLSVNFLLIMLHNPHILKILSKISITTIVINVLSHIWVGHVFLDTVVITLYQICTDYLYSNINNKLTILPRNSPRNHTFHFIAVLAFGLHIYLLIVLSLSTANLPCLNIWISAFVIAFGIAYVIDCVIACAIAFVISCLIAFTIACGIACGIVCVIVCAIACAFINDNLMIHRIYPNCILASANDKFRFSNTKYNS